MGAACARSSGPTWPVLVLLLGNLGVWLPGTVAVAADNGPSDTPPAAAETVPSDEAGRLVTPLHLLPWSVAVLSHRFAGSACWLQSDEGFVRLEWAQDRNPADGAAAAQMRPAGGLDADGPDLRDLLRQRGAGWTVVLGADRTGTVNRWQEEWHKAPGPLVEALRVVLSTLQQGPAPAAATSIGRSDWQPARRTAARRIELTEPLRLADDTETAAGGRPDPTPDAHRTTWRQRLVERGDGRGGEGEILTLTWTATPAQLAVRSSRRPGVLRLGPVTRIADVSCLTPEVFVPLWPLDDLVTRPH